MNTPNHVLEVKLTCFQITLNYHNNLANANKALESLSSTEHVNRSGAVFRSKGSPLNPKDLLQIYGILAVGACVLCQFKVCCDVHTRRNRDSNTCTVLWI